MSLVYTRGKQGLLSDYNLLTDTVNAYLIGSGYTPASGHAAVSDLSSGDPRGPEVLSDKSVTDGVFKAAPTAWTAVAAPGAGTAIVLAVGTNLLLYVNDFGDGPGQTSLTYNGSDIIATWPSTGVLAIP